METGLHVGIANGPYHADRTAVSSTWLKVIDGHSPWHLRSYLDSPPAEPTPALRMGSALDCLIFEPERWGEQFIVAPEINRRTKAEADHKTIMAQSEYQEALQTAMAVRTNPRMADILATEGIVAQPVFVWIDPITGLKCKCKPDLYDQKNGICYDLKSALDASPEGFSKAVGNFGYHIQQAFYSDGIRTLGYPLKKFVFCVQEKPDGRNTFVADQRLTAFYELTPDDDEAGRDSYSSALSAISFCMTNNEWAGYTNDTVVITRPGWSKKGDMVKVVGL
jgi:hypothetical protein